MTGRRLALLVTSIAVAPGCGDGTRDRAVAEVLSVEITSVQGHELGVRVSREEPEGGPLWVSLGVGQGAEVASRDRSRSEGSVEPGGGADFILGLEYAFGDVRAWAQGSEIAPALGERDAGLGPERAFGISEAVRFAVPRIADLQGFGPKSPYANAEVELMSSSPADLVVTSLDRFGFYVTDLSEDRGYGSLYVRAWPSERLTPGARLAHLFGRINEFYGLTELDNADYSVDLSRGPASLPSPAELRSQDFDHLERFEAGLVAVAALRVAEWFGPKLARESAFGPGRSNCDLTLDGEIDWGNRAEAECVRLCAEAPECTEWTQYSRFRTFKARTPSGELIAVDTARLAGFDARRLAGATLAQVSGNLRHFEPGSPGYSIAVRSEQDLRLAGSGAGGTPPAGLRFAERFER